eukprot:TRINITY_DN9203_c0_g1_i1.p1 TRINITY_DN9203_c0_g1~~TRINITY_DN9203_c0_g1_i1.p1  ORF type:complete len:618 (+),score=94.76 TRINITY_DN9203_c0_g1_i1:65-1855(+)
MEDDSPAANELAEATSPVELSRQIADLKEYIADQFQAQKDALDRLAYPQACREPPSPVNGDRPRPALQGLSSRTGTALLHSSSTFPIPIAQRNREHRKTRISIIEDKHWQVSQMVETRHRQMHSLVSRVTSTRVNIPLRCCRKWLKIFFAQKHFDIFLLGIVTLNLLMLSIELEMENAIRPSERTNELTIANDIFNMLFIVELLAKWIAWGPRQYFTRPDWGWNLLDFVIVALSLVEFGLRVVAGADPQMSMSNSQAKVFRVFRVARVGRGLRVMRAVRFLIPLRMLLLSIANALKALVWAVLLIFAVLFGCGFIVREVVLEHCRLEAEKLEGHVDVIPRCVDVDVRLYWGTLGNTMLTLGMAIFGGVNWHIPLLALLNVSWALLVIFLLFVAFMYLAMLNVVTGIFCQQAIESAQKDKEIALATLATRSKGLVASIEHVFRQIDADASGDITFDEFDTAHDDPTMRAFFQSIDMSFEAFEAWTLFSFLDADKDGSITMDEFVTGCLNFGGNARALQSAQIMLQQKKTEEMLKAMQDQFGEVQERLHALGVARARPRSNTEVTDEERKLSGSYRSEQSVGLDELVRADRGQGKLSL